MRGVSKQLLLGLLLAAVAMSWQRPAAGAPMCRGDVNDDGVVESADVTMLPGVLFNVDAADPQTAMRADANGDGVVSAEDLVVVLRLMGQACPGVVTPPSPSLTATPTLTPPPTHTPTHT